MTKTVKTPTTDEEVRARLENAFQFFDQIVDDEQFREKLPAKMYLTFKQPCLFRRPIKPEHLSFTLKQRRFHLRMPVERAQVVYVPEKKTAYVRYGVRRNLLAERIEGSTKKAEEVTQ